MRCSQMKKINMIILMLYLTIFAFISIHSAQYVFADEPLCGIGSDITTSERKKTYQQADQITNLINTATGAISGILGGNSNTGVPKDILEKLFSLLNALTDFEKIEIAQGFVCIPQSTYTEIRDNLTDILTDLY